MTIAVGMEQIRSEQRRTASTKIGVRERDVDVMHVVESSHGLTDDAVHRTATKPKCTGEGPAHPRRPLKSRRARKGMS